MENRQTKALADLIQNPSEISAIISNPAESGMEFYQALPNKDKSYVAFAAGLGLLAYGLYLNRSSKSSGSGQSASSAGSTGGSIGASSAAGASASAGGSGASGHQDSPGNSGKKKSK